MVCRRGSRWMGKREWSAAVPAADAPASRRLPRGRRDAGEPAGGDAGAPLRRRRALYAAFDRFPSRKGAGVHIARFARALFDWAGGGVLYVLGGDDLPAWQSDGDVDIVRFSTQVDNFLERTLAYGRRLEALLDEMPRLEIAHVRDPWSGLP